MAAQPSLSPELQTILLCADADERRSDRTAAFAGRRRPGFLIDSCAWPLCMGCARWSTATCAPIARHRSRRRRWSSFITPIDTTPSMPCCSPPNWRRSWSLGGEWDSGHPLQGRDPGRAALRRRRPCASPVISILLFETSILFAIQTFSWKRVVICPNFSFHPQQQRLYRGGAT